MNGNLTVFDCSIRVYCHVVNDNLTDFYEGFLYLTCLGNGHISIIQNPM